MAQDGSPGYVLRVDVPEVSVDGTVLSKNGLPVPPLTVDDVAVLDNGKPQKVRSVQLSSKQQDDSDYVIVLDASGSMAPDIQKVRQATAALANKLIVKGSRVGIVAFNKGGYYLTGGLTRDPSVIARAVNGYRAGGETFLHQALSDTCRYLGGEAWMSMNGQNDLPGEKDPNRLRSVVLLSDGGDTTGESTAHAIADCKKARVPVHVIDYTRQEGDQPGSKTDWQKAKAALSEISTQTGGMQVDANATGLDKAFALLSQNLTQSVIISYSPSDRAGDGASHKITVQIKNRSDVIGKFRDSYTAPKKPVETTPDADPSLSRGAI